MSDPGTPAPAWRKRLRQAGFTCVAAIVLVVFVEGLSSAALVASLVPELFRPLAERAHTRHDEELGWVSVSGFREEDMYGPGVALTLNPQGFRQPGPVSDRAPDDRSRVICSGDSYTFGPGVGDGETWCAQLARLDERVETVNMGQVLYGLDQTYLWFMRDGVRLRHDVHLIAATADSVRRIRDRSTLSYAKPVLTPGDGRLVIDEVPVPRRSPLGARVDRVARLAGQTRTAALMRRLAEPAPEPPAPLAGLPAANPTNEVVKALLQALAEHQRSRGNVTVLVLLPAREDYADWSRDAWRSDLREAARNTLPVIDLVAELRAEAASDVAAYFLPEDESGADLVAGQYSVAGHAFVARALRRRLLDLPQTGRALLPDAR